jgi:hypothetical protein
MDVDLSMGTPKPQKQKRRAPTQRVPRRPGGTPAAGNRPEASMIGIAIATAMNWLFGF